MVLKYDCDVILPLCKNIRENASLMVQAFIATPCDKIAIAAVYSGRLYLTTHQEQRAILGVWLLLLNKDAAFNFVFNVIFSFNNMQSRFYA